MIRAKRHCLSRIRLARVLPTVLIALPLATVATTSATAQENDRMSRELAGIRRSLEEIAQILRQQSTQQERSLLLRRIEMKNDRLLPVEEGIRSALDSKRHLEAEERRLLEFQEQLERDILDAERGSEEAEAERTRDQLRQLEVEIERARDEAWAQQQRLIDLENERDDLLEEIEALEARLDR